MSPHKHAALRPLKQKHCDVELQQHRLVAVSDGHFAQEVYGAAVWEEGGGTILLMLRAHAH